MDELTDYVIGILAFGSLIGDPGNEINELEIDRIDCVTPFPVEFARISSSRSNAPTLIPITDGSIGRKVKAKLIVLDKSTSVEQAKSILWRRECHKTDLSLIYSEPRNPTSSKVLIGELNNFHGVKKVLYTYFVRQEDYQDISVEGLASFAIESILGKAGEQGLDGVRYLLAAKDAGIETEFSEEYEQFILQKTKTSSLEEAIEVLDKQREGKLST